MGTVPTENTQLVTGLICKTTFVKIFSHLSKPQQWHPQWEHCCKLATSSLYLLALIQDPLQKAKGSFNGF